ncbi:MAG: SDR family oxidoreductase [Flavobacteriaceae bacterium]|nr:SDR family oxidoreductase [Flavobacteriaceae bacterium]
MLNLDLKGQNILLTGASDGIGKAVAKSLISYGARVAVHYNSNKESAEEIIKKCNNGSAAFQANLENEEEVCTLFNNVLDQFEHLDSIILNAGVFIPHSTEKTTEEWYQSWKKTIQINLNSVGILTKMGLDHFKAREGGRFIYVGSRAVFRGETEEYLGYAASKGGLTSLARSVARSFGKYNIKSFIVSPGFTLTNMAQQFIQEYGEKRVLDEISLNELTKPEDLSPLISLMCSGLTDHATGATIDINAGSHIR